ncbi:MAG: 1-(5-phosphoribosyl)-5-[(5-phosphoribosylamino)methylideneamino] imidazole-4-carboxamide isomerase [Candidatus Hydrogenedentes bacterium]|nr:1-(5-phosphoribosyl)-5-[(5-phosphoribosylamino)methylideneamino] imidazole-4-carboxamide isomerase [Candidatus Hydrogenedentota bacterium]
MRIVPAVDIRGGLCVNLVQGDYAQETVFAEDPVAQAIAWRDQGGAIVHIVDLDGAKVGHVCIADALRAMSDAGVRTEVGGGIRTMRDLETVFAAGTDRAILGTAAHQDPAFLRSAVAAFPGKIAVGIDARAGKVSLHAWLEDTTTDAVDFARQVEDAGASRIIYTDILSDGMMKGPNVEATRAVARAVGIPVTVSGGMSSLDDVRRVCAAGPDGVDEVIIGRALYLGAFTLPEAIAAARGEP